MTSPTDLIGPCNWLEFGNGLTTLFWTSKLSISEDSQITESGRNCFNMAMKWELTGLCRVFACECA